jgi:hypothetical protein
MDRIICYCIFVCIYGVWMDRKGGRLGLASGHHRQSSIHIKCMDLDRPGLLHCYIVVICHQTCELGIHTHTLILHSYGNGMTQRTHNRNACDMAWPHWQSAVRCMVSLGDRSASAAGRGLHAVCRDRWM